MSGRICEDLVQILLGSGEATQWSAPGHVRLGLAVLEDYHLLGKQIVGTVLRTCAWEMALPGGTLRVSRIAQFTAYLFLQMPQGCIQSLSNEVIDSFIAEIMPAQTVGKERRA